MCVIDRHDMTLAVKVALSPVTTIQQQKLKRKKKNVLLYVVDQTTGLVFTNLSQEHSLSFSPEYVNLNVTQLLIG